MLNPQTIAIIKSTAPILAEHGETLTRHFYKRMFSHNPEVAPFFNAAHQKAGKQQRALAGAITAYAGNIDNLEALGGAVELIAQKHASLTIRADQYPIVGENLLASIREVLGEGATDAVINAWAEAYSLLADILIIREKQIYAENARKTGGWEGFKPFRIQRKERESSTITSFYLFPADGVPLPDFKPGQYLTVRVPAAEGQTTMRNYSLSDSPGKEWFRISVKREPAAEVNAPAGYVSNLLHDSMEVGDTLEVAPPCGEFFLDTHERSARPLVLLAGGVGVTPILCILQAALEAKPDREIVFIHGSLNEEAHAFRKSVDALAQKHSGLKAFYRYSDPAKPGITRSGNVSTGFIDEAVIGSLASVPDADYYFCGPEPFMAGVYQALKKNGVPSAQIHFEFFGPLQNLEKKAVA
jgi:nitric oxide dioxygenase